MTRKDCAWHIIRHVMWANADYGEWILGGTEVRGIELPRWCAEFRPALSSPGLAETPERDGASRRILDPNRIDLWAEGWNKVLVVEWQSYEVDVRDMVRGSWEKELFGLPAYERRER